MINGGKGEKCKEDRQTERMDGEQGTVGLKYPIVAGR